MKKSKMKLIENKVLRGLMLIQIKIHRNRIWAPCVYYLYFFQAKNNAYKVNLQNYQVREIESQCTLTWGKNLK